MEGQRSISSSSRATDSVRNSRIYSQDLSYIPPNMPYLAVALGLEGSSDLDDESCGSGKFLITDATATVQKEQNVGRRRGRLLLQLMTLCRCRDIGWSLYRCSRWCGSATSALRLLLIKPCSSTIGWRLWRCRWCGFATALRLLMKPCGSKDPLLHCAQIVLAGPLPAVPVRPQRPYGRQSLLHRICLVGACNAHRC